MRPLQKVPILLSLVAVVLYVPSIHASPADAEEVTRLQTAAERGSVLSEIELAANYLVGKGVARDAKLAAHWYEKAAQNGNPDAENQIGYFYQSGIGVPVDIQRALRWYQLAAASGCVIAKVNLGVMYVNGTGVSKNLDMAMQLFEDAARKAMGLPLHSLGTSTTLD